jgi:acyl dehydratase
MVARSERSMQVTMLFFEQLKVGAVVTSPTLTVDRDEMVEFAKLWNPLPIHVDDGAANDACGGGGITAPGVFVFVIAIRMKLIHQTPPETLTAILAHSVGTRCAFTHRYTPVTRSIRTWNCLPNASPSRSHIAVSRPTGFLSSIRTTSWS